MVVVSKYFDVVYGVNLELSNLEIDNLGINLVSRTSKNNGVSARVKLISDLEPNPADTISVSGGGSVMESFLQKEPYYSGRDLFYLKPKVKFSDKIMLFYCMCLRANKYRFSYGRQANKTLGDILIPHIDEIPTWVEEVKIPNLPSTSSVINKKFNLDTSNWKYFRYDDLFEIKKGKRLTKDDFIDGKTPFIGAIDSNNGYRDFIGQAPIHEGNTITINYNGSVGEAFYQPNPFWASDDVNVLYGKFTMNKYLALFLIALTRMEKFRFNYGRKWETNRMNESLIKLPVKSNSQPDFEFMENYIKSLPYSKSI
ncbi:MAG: restriction endonuclease subunit S [Sediminibacterium sp.]|nr:restriction endonuclease subunit S [Sediminibacterium sp.]